jgi:O-antigen/teichoic acid export membrane protein
MVLPVVIFKGSYLTAIYGWVIVSFISLIIAFYFKGIPFKHVESKEASLAYKKIFAYSLPLVSASLWGIAIRSADQFYISRFFGPTIFAEFSNGFIQLPLVSMVTGATSVVLMPVFSKMVNDKSGLHELIAVWRSALIKSATIIYPVVLFFIFFANDIIIILFSKAYEPSTIYFQINMALNFFNIIVFAPLLFSLGKTKIYARIHMFLAVAVWLFEYLVILLFASAIAVAIVSVSLGILNVIIGVVYIAKILQINLLDLIPYKEIIKIVFHALMVAIFVKFGLSFFNLSSPLTELLLAFITFCLILLSSSRFFNLNYLSFIKPLLIKSKFLKSEV